MTWNNRFEGQWKSSTFSLVLIISNAINFLFSLNESKKELRAVNPSQVLICRRPLLSPICPLDTSHAPGQRVHHNHLIYFFGNRNVGDLVVRTYGKLVEKNNRLNIYFRREIEKKHFWHCIPYGQKGQKGNNMRNDFSTLMEAVCQHSVPKTFLGH